MSNVFASDILTRYMATTNIVMEIPEEDRARVPAVVEGGLTDLFIAYVNTRLPHGLTWHADRAAITGPECAIGVMDEGEVSAFIYRRLLPDFLAFMPRARS